MKGKRKTRRKRKIKISTEKRKARKSAITWSILMIICIGGIALEMIYLKLPRWWNMVMAIILVIDGFILVNNVFVYNKLR